MYNVAVDRGPRKHTASFTLGDESSEESETDVEKQSVAVQTDIELLLDNSIKPKSVGPPRSLEECVEILQSEVSGSTVVINGLKVEQFVICIYFLSQSL